VVRLLLVGRVHLVKQQGTCNTKDDNGLGLGQIKQILRVESQAVHVPVLVLVRF
jgi:hypothetical protein